MRGSNIVPRQSAAVEAGRLASCELLRVVMRIAVFGLGYVGSVTGACLARMGHDVCGVDISPVKIRLINRGHSPVVGREMGRLVSEVFRAGKFRATLRPEEAVEGSELSLICVGTPSRRNGEANLDHVLHATGDVGRTLRSFRRYHTIVVRSTVPPGTLEGFVIPASSEPRVRRQAVISAYASILSSSARVHQSTISSTHPKRSLAATMRAAPKRWLLFGGPSELRSL